tara:strand:+ start:1992 stop:2891 length:900 start_codon:yes stop_codon:yes gene_type:complete
MNSKQKENSIKSLIKDYTIETTPNIYEKYGNLKEFLPYSRDVYITYLPEEDSQRVIKTAKMINEEGLNAIPHLPARSIKDYQTLENYIAKLSEYAGCKRILIIGGGGKKVGSINSSLEILNSNLLSKYNFEYIGLAGHPEGHPDISKKELDNAIIEKNKFSKNSNFKIYLVTQFFFEANAFKLWEKHLNLIGNKLDIHAGIPGPANLKILLSFAKSCGIGNSINFLSKQIFNIRKLATTKTPDKLIADLAEYKINNPASRLKKLHLYPFGGMKKTSQWMNTILDNPLEIKNNNEFVTEK